jgi:hypothetical protein
MKPHSDTTWWKRLFTVVEIASPFAMLIWFLYLFSQANNKTLNLPLVLLFVFGPLVILHVIRLAVCYVVEGPKPRKGTNGAA